MPGEPDQARSPQPILADAPAAEPAPPGLLRAEPEALGAEGSLRREEHELPDGRYLIAYWSGGNA